MPALLAEFAVTSWSVGTILGTIANDAGLLICASRPWIAATTNAGQIRSSVTASSGSMATAWARLVAMIVRRRSHRSARLPPYGPNTIPITSSVTTIVAVARPEPVSM